MSRKQIIALFCLAAVVRLAYIGLVGISGGDFANGSDSGKFLKRAANLLDYGKIVYLDHGILIPDTARMPIYPYFLASIIGLFGEGRLWIVSIIQAFIDASTVIAIALTAAAIDRRWALAAAVLGGFWSTLIVYSSYVLTDTLFTAFFCWGLCACLWATQKPRPLLLICLASLAFSCTLLTRPTLLFFPYLILPLLFYLLSTVSGIKWTRAFTLALIPFACLILVMIPRVISITNNYGIPAVTTQTGNHAIDVVAQFLRGCQPCIDSDIENKMYKTVETKLATHTALERRNPVLVDQVRRSVAFDVLKNVPIVTIIFETTKAALRSSLQTGVYETGHQMRRNPKYFSSAPGKTLISRAKSFLTNLKTDWFLIIWLLAQGVATIAFGIQAIGAWAGLAHKKYRPFMVALVCVAAYFLALNGPFGNPRYGMPLTPVFIILTTCGLMRLWDLYSKEILGLPLIRTLIEPRSDTLHR